MWLLRRRTRARMRLCMSTTPISYLELHEVWPLLSESDRIEGFNLLSRDDAEQLFAMLDAREQSELLLELPPSEQRRWMRLLAPDDAADVVQETDEEPDRARFLELLDQPARKEVLALLAYAEDEAGGLMNPRFARLRPDMTVDAALSYLRRQTHAELENLSYPYVLDGRQRLMGVVSLAALMRASGEKKVVDIMEPDVITVGEGMDQEHVSILFAEHDLLVMPVVDENNCVKGIVTIDDIVDVVREEATEDMQKMGAAEALEAPYLQVDLLHMLKKRAPWLAILIVLEFGSVLTMSGFEETLKTVTLLALFVPLIIASGGNSGSQAATLVVRAMALGELRLRDWWRVIRRELAVGITLGTILGLVGMATSYTWLTLLHDGGDYRAKIAAVVAVSILGVALWGTIAGSMLPFLLRAGGFDPASASAPLVATLVDASGLIIYLGFAGLILRDLL